LATDNRTGAEISPIYCASSIILHNFLTAVLNVFAKCFYSMSIFF